MLKLETEVEAVQADAVSFGHCILSFRRVKLSFVYSDYVCKLMLYSFIINELLKLFGISLSRNNVHVC